MNVRSINWFWQGEARTGGQGTPGSRLTAHVQTDLRPHPRDQSRSLQWSLCLCSVGGLILDKTVSDPNFAGMAVFTPVINGEV